MDILPKYFKQIKQVYDRDKQEDYSYAHELEEDIYKKFIKDITSGKIKNIGDVLLVAVALEKYLVEYSEDQTRWYA